jgi:FkbM family methyltransferase
LRRFADASRRDPNLLVDIAPSDGAVVLDIGAYEGKWSLRLLQRVETEGCTNVCIHAFEPVPGATDLFRDALGDDERVELHAFGLGGRDRVEHMAVAGPGSSVYAEPSTTGFFTGTVDVPIRDVDAVLKELAIDRIELMKINIEGGEYELIDRLHDTGWLPRTSSVIVQFHEFAPDAHRARRRNRRQLAETHRCTWNYSWVFERWDLKVAETAGLSSSGDHLV